MSVLIDDDYRHAHILHDLPACIILLRLCRDRPWVRHIFPPRNHHVNPRASLLIVLALGVYFSSFFKDLICSPRPFAPPVTRLSECPSITNSLECDLTLIQRSVLTILNTVSHQHTQRTVSLLRFSCLDMSTCLPRKKPFHPKLIP